jgi:hypothetical protein
MNPRECGVFLWAQNESLRSKSELRAHKKQTNGSWFHLDLSHPIGIMQP